MEKIYWMLLYMFDLLTIYAVAFLWFRFPKRKGRLVFVYAAASLAVILVGLVLAMRQNMAAILVPALALASTLLLATRVKHCFIITGCFLATSILQSVLATLAYWVLRLEFVSFSRLNMFVNIFIYTLVLGGIVLACGARTALRKKRGAPSGAPYEDSLPITVCGILGIAGLFFFSMFMVPVQRASLESSFSSYELQLVTGITVSTIIVLVIVVLAISISVRNQRLQAESQAYALMAKTQQEYYEGICARMESTARLRHDIRGHMVNLRRHVSCNDTAGALEYMESIVGALEETSYAQTGHPLVDALVNDIFSDEVPLTWKGYLPKNTRLSDFDLCILFSNLLKNAYAAARLCSKPFVRIEATCAGSHLKLRFENSVAGPVSLNTGRPGRPGGYGVGNVERVVQNYDGTIRYSNLGHSFCTEIFFGGVLGIGEAPE